MSELFKFNPPKTWNELVALKSKICNADPDSDRLPDDLAFYRLYNQLVPKKIRLEIINRLIGDFEYRILKNNFPYLKLTQHLPWVTHYCLWSRVGKLPARTIKSEITKKFPHQEYFWFENSLNTKSVPEIWHCHLFVKEK